MKLLRWALVIPLAHVSINQLSPMYYSLMEFTYRINETRVGRFHYFSILCIIYPCLYNARGIRQASEWNFLSNGVIIAKIEHSIVKWFSLIISPNTIVHYDLYNWNTRLSQLPESLIFHQWIRKKKENNRKFLSR